MELIIQLVLVLAALGTFLQMSQWPLLPRLIAGLVLPAIAYGTYPWIIGQSKEQLNLWMANGEIMQNLAVIQTVEAVLFIGIDLDLLKSQFGKPVQKHIRYMGYFPGIMWLLSLLYVQMMYFYSFSQMDFNQLANYFTIGIGGAAFLFPLVLRWIIPEHYLRMELRYILSFGQALSAIIITIFCQALPYVPKYSSLEVDSLAVVMALFTLMFLLGLGWSLVKNKIGFKWKF